MQMGLDFNLVEDLVAGVDEVGRGPLCGAVVTAAVILDPKRPILGLNDSKNSLKPNAKNSSTKFARRPCAGTSRAPKSKRSTS